MKSGDVISIRELDEGYLVTITIDGKARTYAATRKQIELYVTGFLMGNPAPFMEDDYED